MFSSVFPTSGARPSVPGVLCLPGKSFLPCPEGSLAVRQSRATVLQQPILSPSVTDRVFRRYSLHPASSSLRRCIKDLSLPVQISFAQKRQAFCAVLKAVRLKPEACREKETWRKRGFLLWENLLTLWELLGEDGDDRRLIRAELC